MKETNIRRMASLMAIKRLRWMEMNGKYNTYFTNSNILKMYIVTCFIKLSAVMTFQVLWGKYLLHVRLLSLFPDKVVIF